MSTENKKKSCKDVYHAFLISSADYDGELEIPCVRTSELLPNSLIPFSKSTSAKDANGWLHFYEHDVKIEALWNNPYKYLQNIRRYSGVISPDYSLYRDMPLCMQIYNIYRGRALSYWLSENGVEVIPNVRWGDERTFNIACLGVEKNKTIAVGTHGCIKSLNDKQLFIKGFDHVINELTPKNVVVYGRVPERIFNLAYLQNINVIHFESDFAMKHKEVA